MNGVMLMVENALSPASVLALSPAEQVDNSTVYARIFIGESTKTPVEGETLATLQNPELGAWYICSFEDANGDVFESNAFQYTYVITKQPTMADPSIEINQTTGEETYQWYEIKDVEGELTPSSSNVYDVGYDYEYDSTNGWSPMHFEDSVVIFVALRLEKGQKRNFLDFF